jgi:hypothetical protein
MSFSHPTHGEHISNGIKGTIKEVVFSLTFKPFTMIDRDFSDAKTLDFKQSRQKAMHSFKHFNMAQALGSVDFERASRIVNLILA